MKTLLINFLGVLMVVMHLYGNHNIPNQLPIGKFGVLSEISQITQLSVKVNAKSAVKAFYYQDDIDDFGSLGELKELISEIHVELLLKNPEDLIWVEARLENPNGEELFIGSKSFWLEKVYDKSGNLSYQTPKNAWKLYFKRVKETLVFPGVLSAKLSGATDGTSDTYLDTYPGRDEIRLPASTEKYQYLVIQTGNGTYTYSLLTGMRLEETFNVSRLEEPDFDGTRVIETKQGGLFLILFPEAGHLPWFVTTIPPSGQIVVDIRSHYGFKPVAVWTAGLSGSKEPHQYSDRMIITGKPGQEIWIYFEFPRNIIGIVDSKG